MKNFIFAAGRFLIGSSLTIVFALVGISSAKAENPEEFQPYKIAGQVREVTASGLIVLTASRHGSVSNIPIRLWKLWFLGPTQPSIAGSTWEVSCLVLYETQEYRVADCYIAYKRSGPPGSEPIEDQIISYRELLWGNGQAILGCSMENLEHAPIVTSDRTYDCRKETYDGLIGGKDSQY